MLPSDAVLIGEAHKSLDQVVRIYVGTHDSRPYVYLSLFAKTREQTDEQAEALNRGVTLRPSCWAELLPHLERAVLEASALDRGPAGWASKDGGDEMSWGKAGGGDRRGRG